MRTLKDYVKQNSQNFNKLVELMKNDCKNTFIIQKKNS